MEPTKENIKEVVLKICCSFKNALRVQDLFVITLEEFNIEYDDASNEYEEKFKSVIEELINEDYLSYKELQNLDDSYNEIEEIVWINCKGIRYLCVEDDFKEICKNKETKINFPKNVDLN